MADNKDYITRPDEKGSINIAEDVIAIIAANSVLEIDGVAALSTSLGKDISELLGKKNTSRGVKITVDGDSITVDLYLMVKLGVSVNAVGTKVQEVVASNIESTTGLTVSAVNVHICGVAFDREK